MVRIRRVWYWKRYMTKKRYRCKRYRLYLPNAIGDALDVNLEYEANVFGPAIIITPKGSDDFLSRLEKGEKGYRGNTAINRSGFTASSTEASSSRDGGNLP